MKNCFCSLVFILIIIIFFTVDIKANNTPSSDSTLQSIQAISNKQTGFAALSAYKEKVGNTSPALGLAIAQQMLATAEKQHSDSNIVKSYYELGNAYFVKNNYAECLKQYTLMLELATKTSDYYNQIIANLNISYIYKFTGELGNNPKEWAKAQVFNERALSICRKYHIENLEANILSEMAVQYDLQKMHTKAIEIYEEAIVVSKKYHRFNQQILLYTNLGISFKNNKQYNKSLKAYLESEHLIDSLKLDIEKAYLLDNMANLYFEMGKPYLAEQTSFRAIEMSMQLNLGSIRPDMYEMLIKLYTKQKRFENALLFSSKLSAVKDSLFNTQKSQQLAELQTRYETDIKDKTIDTQTTLLALNKKQSLYLFVGIALIFLIAIIIFISLWRSMRLNKKVTLQQKELIKQQQELQQVNAIKDRLFSVIGHDLRTPINSLISFTMLLEEGNISQEKMAVYTHELKNNLGYTAGLMENLLYFAKDQMGGYSAHLETIVITDVINDTLPLLLPMAQAKNVTIHNTIANTVTIMADVNMTALIIRNLISNAIKFSYTGGDINLDTLLQDNKIILVVKDNGTGIKESVVHAFNSSFNNLQPIDTTPGTQHEKGTGLGLLLCRNFIQLMDGIIKLESEEEKGSSFMVSFNMGT